MFSNQHCGVLCGFATALGITITATPVIAGTGPTDPDIAFWVKAALLDDPHVDASGIDVKVVDGVVTLTGHASNLATEKYAARDSEKISGVVGVVDELQLAANWRPDFDIAQDVRHRIVNNQMITAPWINVVSSSGEVTLQGEVGSWAERQEADLVAGEVRGVRKVNDELVVEYTGYRNDDDIKADVEAQLNLDVYLCDLPINVSVRDAVVTLTGSVGSKYEKMLAERETRYLSHVKNVKNDLKIATWENRGARKHRSTGDSDSDLRKHVKKVMSSDTRVDASSIDVTAYGGHVTLRGSVPFMYQKRAAARDANNTVGVAWVTNDLLVTAIPRQDDSILTDILSCFDSDYLMSGMDVTIRVRDGVVSLTGSVSSKLDRQHAEELVTRVPGVKKIRDYIRVERAALSDASVTRNIADRLEQNSITAPIRDNVHIDVNAGLVTLSGEVDTWAERMESAQIAMLTPGVTRVHDRLEVRGYPYVWDDLDDETVVYRPYYMIWP